MTAQPVKIIECPRDAWQSMPQQIPAEVKADYLRALMTAGFRHIDAVSFVSPTAVPQMADSEQVLALLDPGSEVEIIAIVVNQQGAERAITTGAVTTLGFPYSLSATFLERNQRQTQQQALQTLDKICAQATQAGLGMVAYLSMAFGNPYGDPWRQEEVITACLTLKELGIEEVSLADTVGMASPGQIQSLVGAVLAAVPGIELGAHLHARPTAGGGKGRGGLPGRLPPPRHGAGWAGRLSLRPGRAGGQCGHRGAITELARLGALLPRFAATGPVADHGPCNR